MQFVNMTPHDLNIFNEQGKQVVILPKSGQLARVAVVYTKVGMEGEIPLYTTSYGEVEGLPEPKEDTTYVVSQMVRERVPHRTDVASPGDLYRDEAGKPIGCKGLAINR